MNSKIMAPAFIKRAAEILGDKDHGLKGSIIGKLLGDYAYQYSRDIPYTLSDYELKNKNGEKPKNKRTALEENLKVFSPQEQYIIIRDLCNHDTLKNNQAVKSLALKLQKDYGHLAPKEDITEEINQEIEETQHYLDSYPKVLKVYNEALQKFRNKDKQLFRNVLDDARLALELMLKSILSNNKSLDNQLSDLGKWVKERGGTPEFRNMFQKILDYYSKYQNEHIKHNDDVVEKEVSYIFEQTTLFLRQLARLAKEEPMV